MVLKYIILGSVKFGPKCFTINQIKKGFGRSTVGHTFS